LFLQTLQISADIHFVPAGPLGLLEVCQELHDVAAVLLLEPEVRVKGRQGGDFDAAKGVPSEML
jgi:hypothetical protein